MLGALLGSPLVPSKPYFPKLSPFGFVCLVHEPESTCLWHDNDLTSNYSRSFHGMVTVALVLNRISWRGKETQLAEASQLFVMPP